MSPLLLLLLGCTGCASDTTEAPATDTGDTGVGLPWVDVSLGSRAACGVRTDTRVRCWGEGVDTGYSPEPYRVISGAPTTAGFVDVDLESVGDALDYQNACARREDGSVTCWGKGGGRDDEGPYDEIRMVYGGVLARQGNTVHCLSTWEEAPCVHGAVTYDVAQYSGGGMTALFVGVDGELHLEWFDAHGPDPYQFVMELPAGPWAQVSAPFGYENACGIRSGGDIECFGEEPSDWPGVFDAPEGEFVDLCVDLMVRSACALDAGGAPTCWGYDHYTPDPGPFVALTCGESSYCGRTADGEVRCWGDCRGGVCDVPP